MDKQHILKHFALLAGLSGEEALNWSEGADLAASAVLMSLREGASAEQNAFLLEYYCACLLYVRFALQKEAAEPESLKAEGFSASRKSGALLRAALALREEAFRLVKGLIRDEGYYFGVI